MKNITLLLYSVTLVGLTLFSYFFVDQNLIYLHALYSGFAFQQRLITTLVYSLITILLFIFYLLFIYYFKKEKLSAQDIKKLVMITCIALLFAYPAMLSYDIFNYLTTAKVLFFHHENPYFIMPIDFLNDPNLAFTRAANKTALYGPLWLIISGIPFILGVGNFFITILGFKLLNIFFYLATIFLIWKLRKDLFSVLLFALNPLVIIETLLSGHNDIVMIFFALGSLLFIREKKYLLAICFITCSIFIKYATLFLLPIFIFMLWKSYQHKIIHWERNFLLAGASMFIIFAFSPLREELYPWYAIWFLPFFFLIPEKKSLFYFSVVMSFGLLLRYIPFMYSGTYFEQTPLIRNILMFIPLVLMGIFLLYKKIFQKT